MEQEIEALERTAAWRRRLADADASDTASLAAAELLEALADDLRGGGHAVLETELSALANWLGESDAISDFADLASEYRARIGATERPRDGSDYLRALLAIARSLV